MGNSDVEDWVLASTIIPGDENGAENNAWDKSRILAEWADGIQIIQTNLSLSSTKARVQFLEELVVPLAKDESEFFHPVVHGDSKIEHFPRCYCDPDVGDLRGFHSGLPTVY